MSTITKKAFAPAQLTGTAATYYTCPANTRSSVKKLTVHNNDTANRAVTVYLVPSAGTAGVTNIATIAQTLAPNESRDLYEIEGHSIAAGDTIQAFADTAAKVTIHGTVVETGV